MKKIGLLALASALLAGTSAPALAATVVATYRGTIDDGFDTAGEFGTANTNLTGKDFVARFVFEEEDSDHSDYTMSGGGQLGTQTPLTSGTLTIDGHTSTFTGTSYANITSNNFGWYSSQSAFAEDLYDNGLVNNFTRIEFFNAAYDGSIPGTFSAYDGTLGKYAYGDFVSKIYNYDLDRYTNYSDISFVITSIAITTGAVPQPAAEEAIDAVPEPATWAMMLVGFGMVAGAARYRRRSATVTFG